MKLVSIDVGLRNLAVCVLEGTHRTDITIPHWDVIDVIGEKNGVGRPLCFHCKKAAMWQQGTSYACSKHVPTTRVPTKTSLTSKKIDDLRKQAEELGISLTGVTKKADIATLVLNKLKGIGWTKFSGGAAVKHAPVLDLAKDIVASLDARKSWWAGTTLVVIENQKDRRMFAVQAMIHMYFAKEGYAVKGVSAVHKLSNILTLDDTTSYRGRKKTGILHCEQLMPAGNREFFRSHKKKDDLADSFLQGLWCLEHA